MPISDSRKGCPYGRYNQRFHAAVAAVVRRVASPYRLHVDKLVQISRTDNICPYPALFHYSLLLITLSEAKQPPQSRLAPSRLPYRGAQIDSATNSNLSIRSIIFVRLHIYKQSRQTLLSGLFAVTFSFLLSSFACTLQSRQCLR